MRSSSCLPTFRRSLLPLSSVEAVCSHQTMVTVYLENMSSLHRRHSLISIASDLKQVCFWYKNFNFILYYSNLFLWINIISRIITSLATNKHYEQDSSVYICLEVMWYSHKSFKTRDIGIYKQTVLDVKKIYLNPRKIFHRKCLDATKLSFHGQILDFTLQYFIIRN